MVSHVCIEEQLVGNCVAFLGAGGEASVTVLKWLLLVMAQFQDVQAKVQHEIDEVLSGQAPHIEDRTRLHFTQAVINETYRWVSINPFSVNHYVERDCWIKVKGTTSTDSGKEKEYFLPQGTTIVTGLW